MDHTGHDGILFLFVFPPIEGAVVARTLPLWGREGVVVLVWLVVVVVMGGGGGSLKTNYRCSEYSLRLTITSLPFVNLICLGFFPLFFG